MLHAFVDVKVVVILKLYISMVRNILSNSSYHIVIFSQVIAQAEFGSSVYIFRIPS